MERASQAVRQLESTAGSEAAENAQYAIALGFRKRTLFKMDFAEAVYISELRSGPAGHFSYRTIAYRMFEEVGKRYPWLAKHFRVHEVKPAADLLER
jgi:thymidylate synthase ThyX